MTKTEADSAGVTEPRRYFRVNNRKANLAPPADRSDWFHMASGALGDGSGGIIDDGGDHIGVVTQWEWPNPLDPAPERGLHKSPRGRVVPAAGGPGHAVDGSPARERPGRG